MQATKCPPPRQKVSNTECLCQLDWNFLGATSCGDEYGGCCNPTAGEDGAFCPIEGPYAQPPNCSSKWYGLCDPITRWMGPCYPWWRLNESTPCPYGRALPGEVTLQYPVTFWVIVGVVYGYVPYALGALIALEALVKRSTRCFAFLCFIGLAVVLGETVFKQIVTSPRPARSCLHSCGMPSSHATLSIGYFTLMLLDALRRYSESFQGVNQFRPVSRLSCCCASIVPLLRQGHVTHREFTIWVIMWAVILMPVPLTRVLLEDHTPEQVFLGGFIGMCEGAIYFGLLLCLERRCRPYADGQRRMCFLHDYAFTDVGEVELNREPQFPSFSINSRAASQMS